MFESPKSLTATVYVRFNYKQSEIKVEASELELINRILDQASDMSPEQRELLLKFADYLTYNMHKKNEQNPS